MTTPHQARELARKGGLVTTSGLAHGYLQANMIALPREYAFDFLLFAQRNPKPCPVVGVLEEGEVNSSLLPGGDIRTDIPAYRVFRDGELVDEVDDATDVWRDDLVTFLIGCSFTFENALDDAGLHLAHIDQGKNVPMFVTNVQTTPAGAFAGPLVVSMRPQPANRVADAVRITSRYPSVHGRPVHVGDPAGIGIADINSPDYGDAIDIPEGWTPMFWACGVTPQAAVMASRPSFAITHSPGKMLVTDMRDTDVQVP